MGTLADMAEGERAVVTGLTSRADRRSRLFDIGVIPGARVECVRKSPLGDPVAYLIRGAVIALRREDAREVSVRRGEP